jgi:hypothetical protein
MPSTSPNPYLPHSRHRRTRELVTLPSECSLPAPKLPAGRKWSAPERALWSELWSSPQASQWDDSYAPAVAQYVVHSCAVLGGQASAWMAQECRHLGDRLGLTPQGLTALGWRLSEPGEPSPPTRLRSA